VIDRVSLYEAPHVHQGATTRRIMWTVIATLVPAGAWAVWIYGWRALVVILVSVAAALLGELIGNLLSRRFTLRDGSAVLSGLLIAYTLPAGVPLYVPIAAALFAMLVIKASFGGLGTNWMNPAVGGQVFAYFSWSGALSAWVTPRFWPQGIATGPPLGLSPLEYIASHSVDGAHLAGKVSAALLHSYPVSTAAEAIASWISDSLRLTIDPHFVDLFFGNVPGALGGVSVLLLLLGSIHLFRRRIITWQAPVAFLTSFLALVWVFGGLPANRGWFAGAPVLQLFSGATVLAALYLISDPVTTPLAGRGMVIFGIGTGIFAFLIRVFGAAGESVFMAILLMNVAVPAINRLTEKRLNETARS